VNEKKKLKKKRNKCLKNDRERREDHMRPIQLTMTAFGPYKDTEVINFSDLDDHTLFVISGNTGAGKTTIFDGICFALYGTASGQDRDHHMMLRSHFAHDDVHTAVELIFEIHGRTFRILRQLAHIKKGNKTPTGERYEFFERIDGEEVPFVDRQIVSEINQKVEDLLGLTQDQFKQIVMLPQGEFLKLLTSETENKEAILRRLFKTEHYKQMNELLRDRKNQIERSLQNELQTRDNYIQHIRATLPPRENSDIYSVLEAEHYNVNQVISGLEKEKDFYGEKVIKDEQSYNQAYKAHDDKQSELHQAQSLNERFREWDEKKEMLESLQKKQPVVKEKTKQLESAERASHIEPYEQQATQWRAEEKTKQITVKTATQLAEEVAGQLRKVEQIYNEEKGKQELREELGKKLDRLQQHLPTVRDLNTRKNELRELANNVKNLDKKLSKITTNITNKQEAIEKLTKKIRQSEQAVHQLPKKQTKLTTVEQQIKALTDYLALQAEQQTLKEDLDSKKKAYEKAKLSYEETERHWLNNQAYVLATHLHAGEPCPVCGSVEHPEKASSDEGTITREQLATAKKTLDQYETAYHKCAALLQTNEKLLKEKTDEVISHQLILDEAAQMKVKLVDHENELKQTVKHLENEQEHLLTLRKEEVKKKDELKALEAHQKTVEQAYQKQKSAYGEKQAVLNEQLQRVPEDVRELPKLEKQIQTVAKQKQLYEQAWEQAQQQLQEVKNKDTKISAQLEHAKQQLSETEDRQKKAAVKFSEVLQAATFKSEDHYKRAKMSSTDREQLKHQIEQFKHKLHITTEQVKELQAFLKDKERVDLTKLKEEVEALRQLSEQSLRTLQASRQYGKEADKLKTSIQDVQERVYQREAQLGMITDLYDVVRGQNSQRISFERFLQIEYLEQIIEAANQRLQHLSNGQFLLMRSDRQEAYGRQSGLAFDVYDAYTGQTRDVKTLSGGEKFNASLCLALGMSDVIQSFQGNISIKTMFIDEGFGTLDEDSLNKSIDTLIDLQASGRMIGVISHVQELKTIFPAVLEVSKTKEGYSETKFIVK